MGRGFTDGKMALAKEEEMTLMPFLPKVFPYLEMDS